MNIGIDIRCLMDKQRTGVGEYTVNFLDAIFKIDKENRYFLFYNSNKDVSQNIPKWEHENVHYVYTRWPNKLLNLLVWLKLIKLDKLTTKKQKSKKAKKQFNNGTIEQWHNLNVWFSPNLTFTNLSENIKHFLTVHDLSFKFFPECFTFKQRLWHWFLNPLRQCQKADIILTPSENTRRDVLESYKVESCKVIKLSPGLSGVFGERGKGVKPRGGHAPLRGKEEMDEVRKKYDLPEKYILFLGTLEPRKNVETIIEAYKMNYESGIRNYDLVIAGGKGWKNKKLMDLISQTEGVRYISYVDEFEKPVLYKNASLFVFPSLYEGFGLPVLEAMASGVPVVASNRSSLPEVAGDAGYLVNPHNVLEISEAMKKILSDEKLRGMLIERGMKRAEEFGWGKAAEKFIKVLKNSV